MDVRDAEILAALTLECRQPLRALADTLGISVTAVHKRVSVLEESGLLRQFVCLPHPGLMGARPILAHGPATQGLSADRCRAIGDDPRVYQISIASGDYLYVIAALRKSDDVADFMRMMEERAGWDTPHVHDLAVGPIPELELDALDYAIAAALRFKARRPMRDVVRSLDTPEQTVRRRLDRLISNAALLFFPDIAFGHSDAQWSVFHLDVPTVDDTHAIADELTGDLDLKVMWTDQFTDAATLSHVWVWSRTLGDLRALHERILADPRVESATPRLLISTEIYPVWTRDEVLRRAARRR